MLLVSSPPALTLAQVRVSSPFALWFYSNVSNILAQISQRPTPGADANTFSPFERLLSRTVFWAYLVLTPPVMIASVMVGLLIVEA
jgi:auxin efflux carrier family protein